MTGNQFPRSFLRDGDVLDDWAIIEPYIDKLRDMPIESARALDKWLVALSEVAAAVHEVGTDRYIKMTCQTDDQARKAAYLDFIENIEPKCKPRMHELNVKYAECPASRDLPRERFAVLDRSIRAEVDVFREENVALQVEEAKLEQSYQEVCGAQTVQFDGKEQTLPQLAVYAEKTDRSTRQRAWEVETERRLADREKLEDIFDELIALRHRMAQNADCTDYREYAFKVKQRFDYTPEDCVAFHLAVERSAVPVMRAAQRQRRESLGVQPLRPWDLSVDVKGRPPFAPFSTVDELCMKVSRIFHRVHPDLGAQFDEMNAKAYLDLASRKGKAPGGYQATYEEARHPFIFMNAVGVNGDVSTMIHEGGHAFHQFAARHDDLMAYRSSPIEFAEVASFGMEMLTLDLLDEFYDEQDAARAKRRKLEGIITLLPWVATIDAFQHFLYTNPHHTRDQRRAHWLGLVDRFGGVADYNGYEEARAFGWQRQLHLFEVPFYYIEYGIAKLGALQVWRNAMDDREDAVRRYREALALGGSKPLPELFETAGAAFDFSEKTVGPLVELVGRELEKLPV